MLDKSIRYRGVIMEQIKKIIDLQPLSDQEIKEKKFSLSDLWMIKDVEDRIFGPYETSQLRTYIKDHEYLFTKTSIYNLEEEKWYNTFSLSQFQRRKPEVVKKDESLHIEGFYLIINGQKNGPYSQNEVQNLLDSNQITSTSELSLDKGKSWIKVYEYHAFDRRSKKSNQELPFQPSQAILEKMAKTKEEIINTKDQEEAIVELAFIGHQKNIDAENSAQQNMQTIQAEEKEQASSQLWKIAGIGFATLCLIVFGSFQIFKGFDGTNSVQKKTTAVKSIDNSDRTVSKKKETRKPARNINKAKKPKNMSRTITRRQRPTPKRYKSQRPIRKMQVKDREVVRHHEIEEIDINNPEVQEQLTRELAGEGDLEELEEEEYPEEILEEEEFRDEPEYGEENLEVHTEEDY